MLYQEKEFSFLMLGILIPIVGHSHRQLILVVISSFFGDEGILFCKPGDSEYQRQDQFAKKLSNISSVGGKIYGIIGRVVHAFEFEESRLELKPILEASWLPYPTPPHISCNYAKYYVIRSQYDDELLIVEKQAIGLFGFEVSHFGVYKANFTRDKGWIKINDMGTRTVFLDSYCYEGMCCSTTDPAIKKNSIYYLNGDNKYIYVWDLEEQKGNNAFAFRGRGRTTLFALD
ncbi:hypothetical protein Tsubulata_047296 [Turnera subulata]|uniref:KIB1-4 beta-propeller domain-containing protein n=1 Tax=Turnera subulata TaxID=218843 RepID=A0A9Q0J0G8_9ROSI|nr:hypothetical protein Tsubulata_047296 [Turnera subulata]